MSDEPKTDPRHRPYCAYCGKHHPENFATAEEAFEHGRRHIETCEKHPLFQARADLAAAAKRERRLCMAFRHWDEAEDMEWQETARAELLAAVAASEAANPGPSPSRGRNDR